MNNMNLAALLAVLRDIAIILAVIVYVLETL